MFTICCHLVSLLSFYLFLLLIFIIIFFYWLHVCAKEIIYIVCVTLRVLYKLNSHDTHACIDLLFTVFITVPVQMFGDACQRRRARGLGLTHVHFQQPRFQ